MLLVALPDQAHALLGVFQDGQGIVAGGQALFDQLQDRLLFQFQQVFNQQAALILCVHLLILLHFPTQRGYAAAGVRWSTRTSPSSPAGC